MKVTNCLPKVEAYYKPIVGWRLFIGKDNVTGFIPRQKLFRRMETRKYYSEGYRGYSYGDWIRHNKWVKALADSKELRMAIFSAIREKDF